MEIKCSDCECSPAEPIDITVTPPTQPRTLGFMHGINLNTAPMSNVTTHDKRMKFVKENGFAYIRYRINWGAYLADPIGVTNSIEETANQADKYGVKVIYTNIQYELSSYFGTGGFGFPPSLVQAAIGPMSGYPTARDAQKDFMRKYWDNAVVNGKALWDSHAEFMLGVFTQYKNRWSTLGYEIWNEPPLLVDTDHAKLKACQQYIADKLVAADPDAWIVAGTRFLWYPVPTGTFLNDQLIIKTLPDVSDNRLIFGHHWYMDDPLPQAGFDYVVGQIVKVQQATGAQVMMGEWNDRTLPADIVKFQRLVDTAKARNWMISLWTLDGNDVNNRCFNLNYDVETARNVWPTLLTAMATLD